MKLPKLPKGYAHRYPIISTVLFSFAVGVFMMVVTIIPIAITNEENFPSILLSCLVMSVLIGILVSPIIVTCYNLFYLFAADMSDDIKAAGRRMEYFTLVYGGALTLIWGADGIRWGDHWTVQQYDYQIHQPLNPDYLPSIAAVGLAAIAGYAVLRILRRDRIPPLLWAVSLGGVYLGIALCAVWILHFVTADPVMCVYPGNIMLIFLKAVGDQVEKWRREEHPEPAGKPKPVRMLYRFMNHTAGWHAAGIVFALPILGLTVAFLALFGQAPDSIIRVWTETADWGFSQRIPPADLPYDGHYLCTVAAGGHRNVVKPIRDGKRHGHRVIVNRQLCIANAFEQLLEERTPRFHRAVRRFYDKHGYPIAKHIRSPYAADVVWLLMKPAEWLFLAVLYLCDAKPENRIAVQYPHSPAPDWR